MKALSSPDLGRLVVSFFEDYLPAQRGMSSVQGFAQYMKATYPCR